jgi:hypothetical protein
MDAESFAMGNIPRDYLPSLYQDAFNTVAVIVENSLYGWIRTPTQQYCQDLVGSGYDVILYTEDIATVSDLKGLFLNWYVNEGLVGAVLIGRLPYAEFHHDSTSVFSAETFICDLYLMDLDGTWSDSNPSDGIFDHHSASLHGDIDPEIFVGRIDPYCLSWIANPAETVTAYLSKLHQYRTGNLERKHRAVAFVDDDWCSWGEQWARGIAAAYPDISYEGNPDLTTGAGWLNVLGQNHAWVHLCAHSSPTAHHFKPWAQGLVTSTDIKEAAPKISFYNLYCCKGAKWTTQDNLAVTYLFSSNYSVAIIGSTKSGGMMDNSHFYTPLGQNSSIGESLVNWFSKSLNEEGEAGSAFLEWYYGMTIVGDPFLRINYDCRAPPPLLTSPTHPNQTSWYADKRLLLEWEVPEDVNGIAGYYYAINRNSSGIPRINADNFTNKNKIMVDRQLKDGTWFVHVMSRDVLGNIGPRVAHYRINIDSESPYLLLHGLPSSCNISRRCLSVNWSATDLCSGYSHSRVWLDQPSNVVVDGTERSLNLSNLTEGQHTLNITVYDAAGNRDSEQIRVCVDLTNPHIELIRPASGGLYGSSLMLAWRVTDEESGYRNASVSVDEGESVELSAPASSIVIHGLSSGLHTFNLTVVDWVDRSSTLVIAARVYPVLDCVCIVAAFASVTAAVVLHSFKPSRNEISDTII